MTVFSIDAELQRLKPIDIGEDSIKPNPPALLTQWDELTRTLARLGKQQLRANQNAEFALEELRGALRNAQEQARGFHEQLDEAQRELRHMRDDARDARLSALGTIDSLDDLMAMARQRGDPQWISRVERLTSRAMESLAQMGLTEIPAAGWPFDEAVHEAVDTIDRGDRDPYSIVEVVRRGFRFNGAVLRRAQVIATQ